MIRSCFTLILTIILNTIANAQTSDKSGNMEVGFSAGLASGWWIYSLGNGAGIDRTDNVPKIGFDGEVLFKPRRIGIGAGLGYSFLGDNTMEAFEDTRAQRSKYFIADKVVQFWTYYLFAEYDIYTNNKYILSPQVRAGGFSINTTHPEKDNFNSQLFLEFSALNQFYLSEQLRFSIRPFYQVMMIPVKEKMLPGEKHRIFSLGLSLGLRYTI